MNRRIGFTCLALVLLALAAQPLLAPYDPGRADLGGALAPPSSAHPLGTDTIGRDVASRLAAGARYSVSVAWIALVVSSVLGLCWGAAAGLSGGAIDRTLSAGVDLLLAFPRFLLLLNLAAVFTLATPLALGALVGITSWMATARLVRTEVLSLRERPFVEAARAGGAGAARIAGLHLAPHLVRLVLERTGLRFAGVILLITSLDYLGIGLPLDSPTWGRMIRDGQDHLPTAPWITLSAVAALSLTSVGLVLASERGRGR